MELNDKLRILRKLKGYTQQTISEQFYVSRQAVQKWESGETSPDISKLPELANIFGVTIDDLLNIELEEKELLKIALVVSENDLHSNLDILKVIKKASTIDWLIFSVVLFGIGFALALLHVFGVLIVISSLMISLSLGCIGIYFIVNFVMNISLGISVLLINLGSSMIGLSLSYLSYRVFILLIQSYVTLVKNATLRFKDYGLLKGSVFYEK